MDPVMQALVKAIQQQMEGMKATGDDTSQYLYSRGGLFGRCDGPAQLINAMVGPMGIEKILEFNGTDTETEFVDTFKAVEESGSEQSTGCGDCVTVRMKACAQLYCFGRFCRQTEEMQFDKIGLRSNANVPVKTLFGSITDPAGNVLIPNGTTVNDIFYLQTQAVGYALRLKHGQLLWTGDPINNAGAYQEFKGLELIINTGKYDAYTELECESIDSFLLNFAHNNPTSDGTYAITHWFRRMINQFRYRAETAGFSWDTATHYIVMSPNMWDHVARVYSCAGIDLCSISGTQNNFNASADAARDRYQEYLDRMALPVNGRWYPVVIDSLMPETAGQPNGIESDIYFLTTEVNGQPVLYGEYQDFNQTYGRVRNELVAMFGSDDIALIDNGRYALVRDNVRGCFDVQALVKPRLVATMPWLSGRIQNVAANVLGEPFPNPTGSGGVYEKDGGRYTTPVPLLYDDCFDC